MIKIIRRYQKGVLGLFAIVFICLAMAGFGLDLLRSGPRRAAITVNGKEVQYEEFESQLRDSRENYQRMFGSNYEKYAKQFNLNLPQQVFDQIVAGELVEEKAQDMGMAVGNQELSDYLTKSFPDTNNYKTFLNIRGMSAPQFEHKLRTELLRNQFDALLSDVSFASRREAMHAATAQETTYNLRYVAIGADDFKDKVAERPDAELQTYFENNNSDFQRPATVSYDYAVIEPTAFMKDVVVTDDDIALYLSEHESEFQTPEQVRVRHIQLLYPKDNAPTKLNAVKARADEALTKARAGEPFESLVLTYSDDIPTKAIGGDLGIVSRNQKSLQFDKEVFKLKGPGIADLISTDTGYEIVKVEEYFAPKTKELKDVKGEIEAKIRTAEAPSYAATKSADIYEEWVKSKAPLSEIAAKNNLTVKSTAGLVGESSDPDTKLAGLTAKVLESSDTKQQLVDLPGATVLAAITGYQEPSLPPFSDVRGLISEIFKTQDAKKAAREKAQEILESLKAGKELPGLAADAKLDLKREADLSKKKPLPESIASIELQKALFSASKAGAVLDGIYEKDGSFIVAQVAELKQPKPEELEAKIDQYRQEEGRRIQQMVMASLIDNLKAKAEIDFDPALLNRQ